MRKRFLVLFAFGLCASLARADDDDPPSRAARLSYISGTVSFQPGSVEDWVPATLNRPLTTGDRLWTESGARAEMHIGSAAVRLNGRTNFAFLNLDDRTAQIQVSLGTVSVRLRRLEPDEIFEIDTPQMALTLTRPGEYRVDVNEVGDATIAGVRGGEAEANSTGRSYTIHARQQVRASGGLNNDEVVFDERNIPTADEFDNWCAERDRREDLSESGRHVSRDIPGYEDLDSAGVWREEPQYGWIWMPRTVVIGWAPYRYGHWVWIAPWGWTWVDDAPWGYAPFHYGRWVYLGSDWAWVPGPVVARPVYAPAMVAWVGGPSFSVGISVGPTVGWFPLGPREVWVPSYHHSPRYIERVNVTNTVIVNRTEITNINVTNVNYVNRGVPNAVTVVPQREMVAGRAIAPAAVRVAPDVAARAEVRNTVAVQPERSAVIGPRTAPSAAPPPSAVNRQVMARQAPPAPAPSFNQQTLPPPRVRQVGPRAAPSPVPAPAPSPRVFQPAPAPAPAPAPSPRQFPQRAPEQQQTPPPIRQPEIRRPPTPQPAPQVQPIPQPERRRPEPQATPAPAPPPQPERRRPEPQASPAPAPAPPPPQPERRTGPAPRQEKQEREGKGERRRDNKDN